MLCQANLPCPKKHLLQVGKPNMITNYERTINNWFGTLGQAAQVEPSQVGSGRIGSQVFVIQAKVICNASDETTMPHCHCLFARTFVAHLDSHFAFELANALQSNFRI